jgi:hypothetical protein
MGKIDQTIVKKAWWVYVIFVVFFTVTISFVPSYFTASNFQARF